jgi:phosphatidate cytidylyltransferase
MSSLMQRVITACVLAAVFLLFLFWLPSAALLLLVTLGVLLGAWEWFAFTGIRSVVARGIYVLFLAALMVLLWLNSDYDRISQPLMLLAMVWWTVALVLVLRYPVTVGPTATALCGVLSLIPLWFGITLIINSLENYSKVIFMVLFVVAMADIGAYFTGRSLGRRKLAPAVSPGKTVEGLVGGLVASVGGASVGAFLLHWPLVLAILLGLAVAAVSVLGDLTVSMFKRNAGLKDSGSLFPGHGGILDRIDGVTAAVPLFVLGISWLSLAESL